MSVYVSVSCECEVTALFRLVALAVLCSHMPDGKVRAQQSSLVTDVPRMITATFTAIVACLAAFGVAWL